jgi:hypothetical protein
MDKNTIRRVEMDEDKPYIYYEEHKRKYPPGQFKNKDN